MPRFKRAQRQLKLAMIRLDRELENRKDDITDPASSRRTRARSSHDEIEQAKPVVREFMLVDQPFSLPLTVDVGIGPNWMDAK